jgi:uncharacterized protein Smg (DUF494 family)
MKERIVEILIYIMSEIQENKGLADIDLGELKEKGYTQSEISTAFSWLYDTMHLSEGVLTRPGRPAQGSRRMLHDLEKSLITTEGQGYLIQLTELGLLDERDVEQVIERAMVSGYEKLTLPELQELVASVLFSRPGSSGSNRSMLNSRDTIH